MVRRTTVGFVGWLRARLFAALGIAIVVVWFAGTAHAQDANITVAELASDLKVGDIVFIRIDAKPFREVAKATGSWTNHVGIVVDVGGKEPLIGESRFPLSGETPLSRFVARSEAGRVAVLRPKVELTAAQQAVIRPAAGRRANVFYDTGFDLDSKRQFCSRYVREVMLEASGVALGEIETFGQLLSQRPQTDLGFWKLWYFGSIPWDRRTVTPASVMASPALRPVFDGAIKPGGSESV